MTKKYKIIVGLSGGVDSSVAAFLLKQAGHDVVGVFMKNWEEDDTEDYCSAAQDVADAQAICDKLNIPLHTVNFATEYWDNVFTHFLAEYKAGRTPNPDILCNREIKFKAFMEYANLLEADYIATGHYVRKNDTAPFTLLKGLDPNKDQSYFLYTLGQSQLAKSLFPIGDYHKTKVREIAEQQGFINYNKKDSTGICFIGERKFKTFLNQYLPAQPGDIQTADGQTIGRHDGLMYYTLGQRKGIGIGGRNDSGEAPWYVVDKDLKNNNLIIGQGHDHPLLLSQALRCNQLSWVSGTPPTLPFKCRAKTRYRQEDQTCEIKLSEHDSELLVTFTKPQRAVTPGQSIVFYVGDSCLGGGVITERFFELPNS